MTSTSVNPAWHPVWRYCSDSGAFSNITVVGVVFSITILALTLASQQFGPRMMRNFVRDVGNQRVANFDIAVEKRYRDAHYDEVADATAADLKKALTPIKAFLTRQGVSHDVLILGRTPR